jgi:hypothetical protein
VYVLSAQVIPSPGANAEFPAATAEASEPWYSGCAQPGVILDAVEHAETQGEAAGRACHEVGLQV